MIMELDLDAYRPQQYDVREKALHFTRLCHEDIDADELIERSGIVETWFAEATSTVDLDRRVQAIRHARGHERPALGIADLLADAMKLYNHATGAESWELT